MEIKEILSHVDHTLLTQTATKSEILALCADALKYGTASVCVPASYVATAAEFFGEAKKNATADAHIPAVCTVVGFPNGYSTAAAKCFEAGEAIGNGAHEIDTVINIGHAKDGRWDDILAELRALRETTKGHILKVIIETCMLTDAEKTEMCRVVSQSGADYIKTSTGFGGAGATFADVELFARNIAPHLKIKAAGGISTIEDAEKFLALGADRLGTSRIVKSSSRKNRQGINIHRTDIRSL
ncbi:MAG: deoxyribose-phosphate aldolase [Clostridia bacterium]|nr:deoxyribose-phosphate aldolase [Clostridia bacterium]